MYSNFNPAESCFVAWTKPGQLKIARAQLESQGYQVATLFEDHLLIQPSVGIGVTPARSTIGVKDLITKNGKFIVVNLQSLQEQGVQERLNTGNKEHRYIELMRIMERDSRKLRQAT
jgi:hypothetical protein